MTDKSFIIKAFNVSVAGFADYRVFAASRGKALSKAWGDYAACNECTFKGFLKICRIAPCEQMSVHFGQLITVADEAAFFISSNRQYIQFVRPNSDVILNAHPYDVEPEEFRPDTYRNIPA